MEEVKPSAGEKVITSDVEIEKGTIREDLKKERKKTQHVQNKVTKNEKLIKDMDYGAVLELEEFHEVKPFVLKIIEDKQFELLIYILDVIWHVLIVDWK